MPSGEGPGMMPIPPTCAKAEPRYASLLCAKPGDASVASATPKVRAGKEGVRYFLRVIMGSLSLFSVEQHCGVTVWTRYETLNVRDDRLYAQSSQIEVATCPPWIGSADCSR